MDNIPVRVLIRSANIHEEFIMHFFNPHASQDKDNNNFLLAERSDVVQSSRHATIKEKIQAFGF